MATKKSVIFLMLLLGATGLAQNAGGSEQPDSNATLSIGPGVVVLVKPYEGVHPTVYPYPVTLFIYDRFYIAIDTAGYRLLANQRGTPEPGQTYWYLDAIAKWRSDGYDADDSDELAGMHNRHKTIDVGGEFGISGDWGKLYTSILTDALGQHDGQEFRVTYAKPFDKAFDVNNLRISPSVGFALLSSNLADYYYGVRNDEARAGRPAYSPGASVNWFLGLDANYRLNDDWTLLTSITYYWLDSDIHSSPIVNKDYAISILAGAMYKF
jgi:outer membrane protein